MPDHTAHARVDVDATPERVWRALTHPEQIATYMHGSRVSTDWQVGSAITWDGEYDGKKYRDKGKVLVVDEPRTLSVTHYSPLSGSPDVPESYHTIVYTLTPSAIGTTLELSQTGNESAEQAQAFSKNWQQMLDGLKSVVEHQ